jgi:hypothetical protein
MILIIKDTAEGRICWSRCSPPHFNLHKGSDETGVGLQELLGTPQIVLGVLVVMGSGD